MRRRRIAFKPAAILADEIALGHRARDQAPRTMSTGARRCRAYRPSSCPVRHHRLAVRGPLASELASQPPSTGLPIPRGYSRVRPEHPNSARQRRWLRAVRHSGVRMDRNRGTLRTVVGVLFPADCRCRPPHHRSRSRPQRRRSHRSGLRRGSLSHRDVPSSSGQATPNTLAATSLPLRTPFVPFVPAVRLIQKSHLAILVGTGSDHSPVAFYFRNGWLFSPEYAGSPQGRPPAVQQRARPYERSACARLSAPASSGAITSARPGASTGRHLMLTWCPSWLPWPMTSRWSLGTTTMH